MFKKNFWVSLIVCIVALAILLAASRFLNYESVTTNQESVVTATVIEVQETKVDSIVEGYEYTEITFLAKVTSGNDKGNEIQMTQTIDQMVLPMPEAVEKGDKILAIEVDLNGDSEWVFAGVNRIGGMMCLAVVFFVLILLIGRGKGMATILSLLLTVGAIFYVYVPSILVGCNVYMVTVMLVIYIVLVSLILLNGFNKKTLCAMVGNVGGTLTAGVLALGVNNMLSITGVVDQDYVFLTVLESGIAIDLKAVVWAGILIGSLGAIMDVAVSIASAMHELAEEMGGRTFIRLVRSGMRIGCDAIGTMTNTLILAYVGGSLAVVLLFAAYNKDTLLLWNLEMIVIEVIQAIVGSMGILIAVPLTVFFSAAVYMRRTKVKESSDSDDGSLHKDKKTKYPQKRQNQEEDDFTIIQL